MIWCPKCQQLVPENLKITKKLNKETHYYDIVIESVCAICNLFVKKATKIINEVSINGKNL